MQELIEMIQSGDLTNNQILQRITKIHNTNCEEMDEAISQIEQLEAQATLNKVTILELHQKLNAAQGKIKVQTNSITVIEKNALEAVNYAQDFQNKLNLADIKLAQLNQYKAEAKKLKPRIKRLSEANAAHQKGRPILKAKAKNLQTRLDKMYLENAKLRMTGHKKVGKYSFTIFPVRVNTEHAQNRVGLVVYNEEGAMKVLTRSALSGEIIQPKSHNFKFKEEETTWINDFFNIADAHEHRFADPVLQFVK